MDRFDPFVKYADVYGDIINWEKDPMNKPQNQNKYFFSDGKTYYEQICKMLRLMSVFKEAFNQIYSNEDEISEAWENFVNNLSASVVEGSEPDVTLTWTDDSVNFEFTMVPGVPGEQGVGITSISFNSDYTMTITLSDGNTYTSMSLKGETGPQGPQGETGSGLQILDVYATLADLQSAHPTGQPGDAYQVGSEGSYTLYIWSSSQSAWIPAGSLGTVSPSLSNPLMDGTASAGSLNQYSRGDHVHPTDTSRASQEELDALIKTSQALIDQSFTYRESPAIQDGLARIDKIKGNTLVWNQLVQNGNFLNTSNWSGSVTSFTVSNNKATVICGQWRGINQVIPCVPNHKYLFMATCKQNGTTPSAMIMRKRKQDATQYVDATVAIPNTESTLFTVSTTEADAVTIQVLFQNNATDEKTIEISNVMLIDLTKLGLASINNLNDFKDLFQLPYYDYNVGSLLSFNGNGLKTTGKNLLPKVSQQTTAYGITYAPQEDGTVIANGTATGWASYNWLNNFYLPKGTYTLSGSANVSGSYITIQAGSSSFNSQGGTPVTFELENDTYVQIRLSARQGTVFNNAVFKPMLEFGSSFTSYEPYTESTLSLHISTYFPNGMKSAGNVYDELLPSKAITRVGMVDLGSLNYTRTTTQTSGVYRFIGSGLPSDIKLPANNGIVANMSSIYTSETVDRVYNGIAPNMSVSLSAQGTFHIRNDSYTTAEAFKSAMSGVYLYYELATPEETAIIPEIDLSFRAYLDGTEQLLPVNGSVPVTSPILTDMTYMSIDDAMEYILEKLANVPQNTQQILDSLEDDVADLQTDVGALQPAVSALQTSVGNINTNIGQLSSTVAGHTSSISDIQSDITDLNTGLSNLEDTVTDNTSRIGTLETGLSATNGNVQNLETSVSDLDDTVTAQGTTVTALDSIIQDISNNPVISSLGSHELGFVAAYVSATLAANTGTKVTIPKPTIFPNNYTPLFIVGMSTGSYNVSICEIPYSFGNRDSVNCRVWNHGSEQTTQITVYILCMRQRQSQ